MAHWAKLDDNNRVVHVIVLDDSFDEVPFEGKWVQTSYSGSFRGKYAGVGDFYNEEEDIFYCDTDIVFAEQQQRKWL